MATFKQIWDNHVGRAYVCDRKVFANQCAMRMGEALERSGVKLKGRSLKRCNHYSRKFKDHKPGHIRSAQQLANVFYRNPSLLGPGVKKKILTGSINGNLSSFKGKRGMVFIMNGWGSTDHIDVWDGVSMKMKGTAHSADYSKRGKQVWFWELK